MNIASNIPMYIICKMIYLLTNYLISVMFHTFLLKVRSDRTSNHLGYNLAMLSYKKRHDFFSLFALLYLFNIKNIWGLENRMNMNWFPHNFIIYLRNHTSLLFNSDRSLTPIIGSTFGCRVTSHVTSQLNRTI